MDVRFEVLAKGYPLRSLLEQNGWRVEEDRANCLPIASHPAVGDQTAGRSRLHKMGLLTSSRLRIEFGPSTDRLRSGCQPTGAPGGPASTPRGG